MGTPPDPRPAGEPEGSTFDYANWVRRGVAFVSTLPDRVTEKVVVSLRVEPPPDLIEGLPDDYYEPLGSAAYQSALRALPERLQQLYSEGATQLACLYELRDGLLGGPEWDDPEVAQEGMREALGQSAVPFLNLANGDTVALLAESGEIAYLMHDGDDFILAQSLDIFLTEWERCCYAGPEWWILKPFRDANGLLSGDTEAAVKLRQRLGGKA